MAQEKIIVGVHIGHNRMIIAGVRVGHKRMISARGSCRAQESDQSKVFMKDTRV